MVDVVAEVVDEPVDEAAVEVAADDVVDAAVEVVVVAADEVVDVAAEEVVDDNEAHLELNSSAYSRMFISRPLVGIVMTQSGGLSEITSSIRPWQAVEAHMSVY